MDLYDLNWKTFEDMSRVPLRDEKTWLGSNFSLFLPFDVVDDLK